jgi:hypothetical protein
MCSGECGTDVRGGGGGGAAADVSQAAVLGYLAATAMHACSKKGVTVHSKDVDV